MYCFPLEFLRITENLRLPEAKRNHDLVRLLIFTFLKLYQCLFQNSKIIRKCRILPHANVSQIEQQREGTDILNSNEFIKQTGVRVDARRFITAPANIFVPPTIIFKENRKNQKT